MATKFARPVHPGEVLREAYLLPLAISAGTLARWHAGTLARRLHVPRTRIERLVKEETGVAPDTALRLAKFFDTTPEFWMNFQVAWELAEEAKGDEIGRIEGCAETWVAA